MYLEFHFEDQVFRETIGATTADALMRAVADPIYDGSPDIVMWAIRMDVLDEQSDDV